MTLVRQELTRRGILVPKTGAILEFFPILQANLKNPRRSIVFFDEDEGRIELYFIYYNNNKFGGTRDEYRLTGLTRYMRERGLRLGDVLLFGSDPQRRYRIGYIRRPDRVSTGKLKLGRDGGWRVVQLRGKGLIR
jgi:hypothetical protein